MTSFAASSSVRSFIASRTLSLRVRLRPWPRFWNMLWICDVRSSMPGGAKISICACVGGHFDFDLLVVELAFAQLLAEFLPRRIVGLGGSASGKIARGRQQHVEHAVLGEVLGLMPHFARRLLARVLDRRLHEIADDRVHVAADVADFGELGRFDFHERRIGEPREPPRDLGLAHAGRPDHEDVLRRDFLAQRFFDLLAAPAVAQRDRDGALGVVLADDVLIELVNDFLRGHSRVSMTCCWFV